MAILINHEQKEFIHVPTGICFTTLYPMGLTQLYRGDSKGFWFFAMLTLMTLGIYPIVAAFLYNKQFAKRKILEGWMPASKADCSELGLDNIQILAINIDTLPETIEDVDLYSFRSHQIEHVWFWFLFTINAIIWTMLLWISLGVVIVDLIYPSF